MKEMNNRYTVFKVIGHIALWIVVGIILYYFFGLPGHTEEHSYSNQIQLFGVFIGLFYLNYYFLIPKFLFQKRFRIYAFSIIGIVAVLCVVKFFLFSSYNDQRGMFGPPPPSGRYQPQQNWTIPSAKTPVVSDGSYRGNQEEKKPNTELAPKPIDPELPADPGVQLKDAGGPMRPHSPWARFWFINFGVLLISSISLTVSTSIRGTSEWFKNEKILKDIENKKLSAELSYLKAQINPHFFFNTLNGIYALALQKSDKTPDLIMKLSIIMRYIIYEANAPKVPLVKELKHIANYIELQRIRLTEMVKVIYEVHGSPQDIMIEPLLFSVFVENAFKHGIDYSKSNTIKVCLDIQDNELILCVSNPIVRGKILTGEERKNSGVGLVNIRKRLKLLYPNRHLLKIEEVDNSYQVKLKLILSNKERKQHMESNLIPKG